LREPLQHAGRWRHLPRSGRLILAALSDARNSPEISELGRFLSE
jgi:hypothetical protein